MDNSIIGIRISDQNDHTSYANKALLEIFGYQNIDEVKKSLRKNIILRRRMPVG